MEGVDYAGTRPNPTQLYAAGKRFVVRYGGPGGSWKHLDATEARALTGAGLALVANAEGAADGLLLGWDAGVSWARSADAHFRALGMPADRPIYLSVDFDCGPDKQWAAVANALRGAASVIGAGRVGVYGSYDVMQWARRDNVARWYWQTYAWSGGRWASHNHLEQYRNGVSLAGGTVDLNRSKIADFGQWGQEEDDVSAADVWAAQFGFTRPDGTVEAPAPAWAIMRYALYWAWEAAQTTKAIAEKVDISPEELAAIKASAREGALAGLDAGTDDLVAAVVAALPDAALTRADVETAVRSVLGSLDEA
ncbi:MAG TPA: DUF1906 domain-containing protein [Jiangellales bacterium]|nr:DUF1906 domain-containing protein [Jiangellales bacterium]